MEKAKEVLQAYRNSFGQAVNFLKSPLIFSKNDIRKHGEKISSLLGIDLNMTAGRYLGLPTPWRRSKKETLSSLKQRIMDKMKGRKQNLFPQGGREVLIKTVESAMPTYNMSCLKLPKGWYDEINSLVATF